MHIIILSYWSWPGKTFFLNYLLLISIFFYSGPIAYMSIVINTTYDADSSILSSHSFRRHKTSNTKRQKVKRTYFLRPNACTPMLLSPVGSKFWLCVDLTGCVVCHGMYSFINFARQTCHRQRGWWFEINKLQQRHQLLSKGFHRTGQAVG